MESCKILTPPPPSHEFHAPWRAVVAACLLAGAGCSTPPVAVDGALEPRLAAAERAFDSGDATRAAREFDAILKRAELTGLPRARAHLGRAEARLADGRIDLARLDLVAAKAEIARGTGPGDRGALESEYLRIGGDLAFEDDDPRTAADWYERGLKTARTARAKDLLHYRMYLATRRLGRPEDHRLRLLAERSRPEFARLEQRFLPPPPPVRTSAPTPVPVARASSGGTAPAPRTEALTVLPRARWQARAITPDHDPMGQPFRITVHHSATPFSASDIAATASHIRSIQRTHQGERGWADIAYHYLIDRAGRVWEGRSVVHQGAHAGNSELNRGNIGVCLLGDFGRRSPDAAQQKALFDLLDHLRQRYGISDRSIATHRELREDSEHGTTACPGPAIAALVEGYRSRKPRAGGPFTSAAALPPARP